MHKGFRFVIFVLIVLALLVVSLPSAFATAPSCGASDTTPAAGQTINVFGSGWAPDRGASIKFAQSGNVERLGRAQTDSGGNFSKDVMIPGWAADGSAKIVVKGNTTTGGKHACQVDLQVGA